MAWPNVRSLPGVQFRADPQPANWTPGRGYNHLKRTMTSVNQSDLSDHEIGIELVVNKY